jgi:hypothetical protein
MSKKYEPWEARLGVTSFDPLEVIQLVDAIRARAETVTLTSGTFKLKYEPGRVHYSPERGFTPTGWIDIERIEREG